mmetsp:Transcript_19985/g.32787  ORF Transcript_19985/g.32787 Transcript_19985/m.32787 type:complete len:190 (-) Transcript_19985:714-1283(-)
MRRGCVSLLLFASLLALTAATSNRGRDTSRQIATGSSSELKDLLGKWRGYWRFKELGLKCIPKEDGTLERPIRLSIFETSGGQILFNFTLPEAYVDVSGREIALRPITHSGELTSYNGDELHFSSGGVTFCAHLELEDVYSARVVKGYQEVTGMGTCPPPDLEAPVCKGPVDAPAEYAVDAFFLSDEDW